MMAMKTPQKSSSCIAIAENSKMHIKLIKTGEKVWNAKEYGIHLASLFL